jgi:hypothetical protein
MDTSTWLGEFAADDLSPLERSMALAGMRDRKDELDADREQADKDAASAERREALLLANHQAGDPPGTWPTSCAAPRRNGTGPPRAWSSSRSGRRRRGTWCPGRRQWTR